MRIKRLAVTTAICAMAAFTAGSTPAWAEPPSEATTAQPQPDSALANWSCDGRRVNPTVKAALLQCGRSGPADTNWVRGVWDCDWQGDIWTGPRYYPWSLTQSCNTELVGWDFVYGWG
ncbi:hypothetical protein [Nonomuraea endophytica]|uniref:Secreted protein n=1 Tax=Nonomuraea endophytica TaxID=714136 RepID=A0A7W7ZX53_9ACTN|nr:hypothetical protein [Nonomuraea endophytica]MBB5075392.1 hypothetical protein [Nonomuraea endophytica]